ncbi:channel accessory protein ArfB [Mycolicibacterium sp. 22603]
MDFLMQWFGYLLAFVLGSALTWTVLVLTVTPRPQESEDRS